MINTMRETGSSRPGTSHRGRRRRGTAAAVTAAATALICAACGGSPSAKTGGAHSAAPARTASLTILPSPDGPFTDDFNPYDAAAQSVGDGATAMIYEPLLQFNILKANAVTPWLATGYTFSNGGKTLTFTLRSGVKWSDGTPMTSADVAFTVDMLKRYPAINTTAVDPTSVSTPTSSKVVLQFAAPQYVNLINIAQIPIVPKHIWAGVNPVTYTDTHPVGTGPYTLQSFSSQSFTLVRNPHYWQAGLPKVDTLVYPGYDSNSSALGHFSSVDWGGLFVPDVQKIYVAAGNGQNHYWFPAAYTVALLPNTAKYPLNLVDVRKAISLALDRATIDTTGEDGYEPPVSSLTGIIPGQSSYLDSSDGAAPAHSVSQAKALLKSAGLKPGPHGYLEGSNGQPINLSLVVPSSFTDYVADTTAIKAELQAVGLNVTVSGVAINTWTSDQATGNFDLTINSSASGPTPYYMYNNWLNSAYTAPIGKSATTNFVRWDNAATDRYLADFAATDNRAAQQRALDRLEGIMVNDLPVIPLMYGVAWDEYSTKSVTGWPDASNPYVAPAPYLHPGDEMVILHLTPK